MMYMFTDMIWLLPWRQSIISVHIHILPKEQTNMDLFKKVKGIIYSACLYFTAAEFLILITATLLSNTAPENGAIAGMFLNLGSTALVFLACLIMAALNLVWKLDYSLTVRTVIHFVGALAAWTVIFIIIPGVYTDVSQIIVRSAVFAAIYLVVALFVSVIRSIIKNRRSEELEYENKFGTN